MAKVKWECGVWNSILNHYVYDTQWSIKLGKIQVCCLMWRYTYLPANEKWYCFMHDLKNMLIWWRYGRSGMKAYKNWGWRQCHIWEVVYRVVWKTKVDKSVQRATTLHMGLRKGRRGCNGRREDYYFQRIVSYLN